MITTPVQTDDDWTPSAARLPSCSLSSDLAVEKLQYLYKRSAIALVDLDNAARC